jgi:hypothetical protein
MVQDLSSLLATLKKGNVQLIDKQNSSSRIVKPIVTPKFSAVWNSFSCIYVNDIKQEYVILFLAFEMTFFNYKNKKGTRSLEK